MYTLAGFAPGTELAFLGRKNTGDVNDEMDADEYEKWFLNNCQKNAAIVLDNAPYHTRRVEPIPNSSRKADVMKWIIDHGISVSDDLLKKELLHIVTKQQRKYLKYIIDEMVRNAELVIKAPALPLRAEPNRNGIKSVETFYKNE